MSSRPQRLLRISRACDFCHKRRIKCQDNHGGAGRCRNCTEFDIPCTYARPSRRGRSSPPQDKGQTQTQTQNQRQNQPQTQSQNQNQSQIQNQNQTPNTPQPYPPPYSEQPPVHTDDQLRPTWQAFAQASTPILQRLLTVYHETVFPIFPFFDPVRVQRRLRHLDHVHNRSFFCSVMAACALASARARDGAPVHQEEDTPVPLNPSETPPPEMFLLASEEALPSDLLRCTCFDYLRAFALLAVVSIQDAQIRAMHKYIGHYFTVLAINRWHDEANWPQGLDAVDVEERRRLYWSVYTLDVYASIIWDGCIHFQETHAKVEYPTGCDEGWTDTPKSTASATSVTSTTTTTTTTTPTPDHWIVGWNFTTDLYRILEHYLNKLRSRASKFNMVDVESSLVVSATPTTPGSASSPDRVAERYAALPAAFQQLRPATGDLQRDIFGFQAANIQATMALLEMVHLSLEREAGLERKCSVVRKVLATFHQVPREYLQSISTPLIYHIGGIGVILGSVMTEGPLSETTFRAVRDLLLSMAELLESLEAGLHNLRAGGPAAGQRLRQLVARLEAWRPTGQGGGEGELEGEVQEVQDVQEIQSQAQTQTQEQTQTQLETDPERQVVFEGSTVPLYQAMPMTIQAQTGQQQELPPQPQPQPPQQQPQPPPPPPPPTQEQPPPQQQLWDPNQFQLPDEFLHDFTWPFTVSNTYLSF